MQRAGDFQRSAHGIGTGGEQLGHRRGVLQMAFGVREAVLAEIRDGALVTQGCQHVLQRPALGDVVVDVVRGHERHRPGEPEHPLEPAFVVGPAMQLGDGVGAIAEELLVASERSACIGVRFGQQRHEQDAREQAGGVVGDVVEREPALSLRRGPATDREQTGQPAIRGPVGRPDEQRRSVGRRDFGADERFQARRLGRGVDADDAGQRVAIGDGEGGQVQLDGPSDKLVGVRGPFEEGEVRPAAQLGVMGGDVGPGFRRAERTAGGEGELGHGRHSYSPGLARDRRVATGVVTHGDTAKTVEMRDDPRHKTTDPGKPGAIWNTAHANEPCRYQRSSRNARNSHSRWPVAVSTR